MSQGLYREAALRLGCSLKPDLLVHDDLWGACNCYREVLACCTLQSQSALLALLQVSVYARR